MTISTDRVSNSLAEIFGFHSFRPHQEEIIRAVLGGSDVFAVMPTGGGKSLCYQLPAHLLDGVCIVVSPLISLMKDQVDAARTNGLRAGTLNSAISQSERNEIGLALRKGEMDLLYISPERFNSEHFLERLKTLDIAFFAIDEAHCISEWGHDFRPDYLALSRIVDEFPGIPVAAFTATATPQVAEDIVARLKLRTPHLTRASFNRPNLFYRVEMKRNIDDQLHRFVSARNGESGIIYRTSRKKVESTAAMLQSYGFSARAYHAGMSDADRHAAQEAFSRDECPIIVATVAFGMGIDKSNVRFVVHADLPKNIEGYYQETGRAGRDGEPAACVLFYGRQDSVILSKFAEEIEDPDAREIAKTQLRQMIRFAEQDACRRAALLRYFGEEYPEPDCGGCDYCSDEIRREDATVPAQKILSAVHRTGERFGAVHVCDIVVGANTEKIRDFRHDQLPTFGVGKDRSKSYWRAVVDALLSRKILAIDDPARPVLQLTEAAWEILKGKRTFQMVEQHDVLKKPERKSTGSGAPAADLSPFGEKVFQSLRDLRTQTARSENLPPYIVFSDRSLSEMSLYLPLTDEEFLQISGVGLNKLEKYGERFLAVIRKLCDENAGEAEKSRDSFSTPVKTVAQKSDSASSTVDETRRLFEEGRSIEEIVGIRGMAPGTIVAHLERLGQSGYLLPVERFFTPERLDQIAAWFHAGSVVDPNDFRLKSAVEASEGELGYDEARLARIFLK